MIRIPLLCLLPVTLLPPTPVRRDDSQYERGSHNRAEIDQLISQWLQATTSEKQKEILEKCQNGDHALRVVLDRLNTKEEDRERHKLIRLAANLHNRLDTLGCERIRKVLHAERSETAREIQLWDLLRSWSKALGVHILPDPALPAKTWDVLVAVPDGQRSFSTTLADLLAHLQLDYRVHEDCVVVSKASRLWSLPVSTHTLTKKEREDIKDLLAALGADDIEKREEAVKRLRDFDGTIIPDLQEAARSSDSEKASRAQAILDAITRRYRTAKFGRPLSIDYEALDGQDKELKTTLAQSAVLRLESKNSTVGQVLHKMGMLFSPQVACSDEAKERGVTIDAEGVPAITLLRVVCSSQDLDLCILRGALRVGTREQVEAWLHSQEPRPRIDK